MNEIKPAYQVRAETIRTNEYQQALADEAAHVINAIELARSRGLTRACFSTSREHPHYAEVKRMFQEKGYDFQPTGYCGGVWQLSEDICW